MDDCFLSQKCLPNVVTTVSLPISGVCNPCFQGCCPYGLKRHIVLAMIGSKKPLAKLFEAKGEIVGTIYFLK